MKSQSFKWNYYFILSLCIVLIFLAYLIYKNSLITLGAWNATNRLQIFLKVDSTSSDKNRLISEIKALPEVAAVYENDRQKSAETFKSSFKSYADQLLTEDEWLDLLPESFEVELKENFNIEQRQNIYTQIGLKFKSHPHVDEIIDNTQWLQKFEKLDRFIKKMGIFSFVIILIFISYFVSLMLKVYIDESKSEIEVYTLLGATSWSLYRMFTQELLKWLVLSLVLATTMSLFLFKFFKTYAHGQGFSDNILNQLQFTSFKEIILISVFIIFFTLVKSMLTLQKSLLRFRQLTND